MSVMMEGRPLNLLEEPNSNEGESSVCFNGHRPIGVSGLLGYRCMEVDLDNSWLDPISNEEVRNASINNAT